MADRIGAKGPESSLVNRNWAEAVRPMAYLNGRVRLKADIFRLST